MPQCPQGMRPWLYGIPLHSNQTSASIRAFILRSSEPFDTSLILIIRNNVTSLKEPLHCDPAKPLALEVTLPLPGLAPFLSHSSSGAP